MNKIRLTAICATVAIALLFTVVLTVAHLTVDARFWPPHPRVTELVEVDEEFVELFEPKPVRSNPSPAYAPEKSRNLSQAGKAGGNDIADAGDEGIAAPIKTSERESSVKSTKKDPADKEGPIKKADDKAKASRQASKDVADAFSKEPAPKPDNTNAKGKQKGDTGSPDGKSSDVNGSGNGTVDGGWIMPRYAKVKASATGSIELRAIIDSEGRVKSVELTGGKAPASADPALVARCKAEVKRHRFTRNDDKAPERAVARIIYNFK